MSLSLSAQLAQAWSVWTHRRKIRYVAIRLYRRSASLTGGSALGAARATVPELLQGALDALRRVPGQTVALGNEDDGRPGPAASPHPGLDRDAPPSHPDERPDPDRRSSSRPVVLQVGNDRTLPDLVQRLIDLRDDIAIYIGETPSEEVSVTAEIASDGLAEALASLGVVAVEKVGPFDPDAQTVVGRVETSDPARDRTVARTERVGYEVDGERVREQEVVIYTYTP